MLESERGGWTAWELHRLARAQGRTAWETLHDPHLRFNLTVMRAHDKAKHMRFALSLQQAEDKLGAAIQMLYEDA